MAEGAIWADWATLAEGVLKTVWAEGVEVVEWAEWAEVLRRMRGMLYTCC